MVEELSVESKEIASRFVVLCGSKRRYLYSISKK
jgi:hypothetical protein